MWFIDDDLGLAISTDKTIAGSSLRDPINAYKVSGSTLWSHVCVAATKGTLGILATLPSRNSVSNNCSQVRQSPLDMMAQNQEEDDN